MLASPGVELRRVDNSSITHVLIWILQCRKRTFSNSKHNTFVAPTTIVVFTSIQLAVPAGSGNHARKCDVLAILPTDIPPVSVGRPAAENGHAT